MVEASNGLLEEVLRKLPDHDLEDRITLPPTLTTSIGGYSDIYQSTFKDGILNSNDPLQADAIICMVCRRSGVLSVCGSCTGVWEGKLAIKKIRVHIQNRDHSKAVAKELHVLSKLSHPNILPFTGFLVLDHFPAIVTPWVEKGSLSNQIQKGTLNRSDGMTLGIARGIADGLSYLHKKNVLHCDLKSGNILLSSKGAPLLADFGLSRISGDDSVNFSQTTARPGTLQWAAPELFGPDSRYSEGTDVWAFGMTLYEVISHKLPYFEQSNHIQIMNKIISGDLPTWHEENNVDSAVPHLTLALRKVCEECWTKVPEKRPTMPEVKEKIDSIDLNVTFGTAAGKAARLEHPTPSCPSSPTAIPSTHLSPGVVVNTTSAGRLASWRNPISNAFNSAKNMLFGLTEVQTKITEATNEDPRPTSFALTHEIVRWTFDFQKLNEIMPFIYSRLTGKQARQWREVCKALELLEVIVKHGSEQAAGDARSQLTTIEHLRNFYYIDEGGVDQGKNVRDQAKKLAELLVDVDRTRAELRNEKANHNKSIGVSRDSLYERRGGIRGRGHVRGSSIYDRESVASDSFEMI